VLWTDLLLVSSDFSGVLKVPMSNLPVACTLSPDALATRRQGLLADLVRRAQTHEELANGHRLSFAGTDDTLAIIFKAVEAERRCCRFLRFQIIIAPGEGPVSVELTGPAGTREFVAALLRREDRSGPVSAVPQF